MLRRLYRKPQIVGPGAHARGTGEKDSAQLRAFEESRGLPEGGLRRVMSQSKHFHDARLSTPASLARRFSALKPQPLEQVVLNRPTAIDEAEGAIKRLTPPECFVLLFWQAFKEMVRW